MDEAGLVVKSITPEGFVKFQPLGGWLDQALINQRFVIVTRSGEVKGITGIKSIHVMPQEERGQVFKRDKMFLDVGAKNKEDAEQRRRIQPGDPIAPESVFTPLNGGGFYLGKAWDDRVSLAVMVEVMRRLKEQPPPNTVFAVDYRVDSFFGELAILQIRPATTIVRKGLTTATQGATLSCCLLRAEGC